MVGSAGAKRYWKRRGGRGATGLGLQLFVVVMLVAGALVGPGAAEPSSTPNEKTTGTLYLTDSFRENAGDVTCPYAPRYDLVSNETRAPPGKAYAGTSDGPGACPAFFTYRATSNFNLNGQAHVLFWVACDPASATTPLAVHFQVLLTNNPAPGPDDPNWVNSPAGDLACTSTPFQVKVEVPTRDMTFRIGDSVTLATYASYLNPAPDVIPNLHYVTGGDDPSRIEATGLPHVEDESAILHVEALPRLTWTGNQTGSRPGDNCSAMTDDAPIYAMQPGDGPVAAAKLYAPVSTPEISCPVSFNIVARDAFTLSDTVRVPFWYACDQPIPGSDGFFRVRLYRNADEIAPATVPGDFGSVAVCSQVPVQVFMNFALNKPAAFKKGDNLKLEVYAYYTNPSRSTQPQLYYLVGGDHASYLESKDFPWGNATAPPPATPATPTTSTASKTTPGFEGAGVAFALAVAAAALVQRRR